MEMLSVALTSILSAAALFALAKIMGHKQMSQLDIFDYITGITIGSIAAELATEIENPLAPFAAMLIYGAIAVILSYATSKAQKARKYINGTPTIVMHNGRLYRENMKKAKLDLSEFMMMCRQAGYFNLSDIKTAVFEYNGRLSILPMGEKRPATPADLNIAVKSEDICTEVIMDGRILEENLKRMGLDAKWLRKQIVQQGYGSEREIFLGICDENKSLSLYAMQ